MKTENGTGRKKITFRFVLLYIVSIVLLSIIFTALWNAFTSPAPMASQNPPTTDSEEVEILAQDELLHNGLKNLQLLDNQYALLLSDSANKPALDRLNELISTSETSFGNTIDSINSQKTTLNNSDEEKLDSIISAFRIALNYRKSVGFMREALSGQKGNVNEDKRELLKLKMQLQDKDNKIVALQDQVKMAKREPEISTNSDSEVQIESLQANITKSDEKISNLTDLNNSLTKDNSRITAQLNELKSNSALSESQKKTMQNKNEMLQNKIDDLNADLIFAKVDCNLSRADAKQIISNSRQRKDLLQESLNALNNLSRSGDDATQRKAKEKLNQLQRIAATIRD